MTITAVFPGTFDPITNGHVDIIERASRLFPKLIVAVAEGVHKQSRFSLEERQRFVQDAFADRSSIEVMSFTGLLVKFCQSQQATVLVRGLRDQADFAYESKLATMNELLASDIQTVYIQPDRKFAFLSSTLVREVASLGGELDGLVPDGVIESFKA